MATAFSPRFSSRAIRSKVGPWNRGEHAPMTRRSRPRGLDRPGYQSRALGPAQEWQHRDLGDSVERPGLRRQGRDVQNVGDVAAALAQKHAGSHRTPIFCNRGVTSCEWDWRPQSFSGSAPIARARSC